MLIGSSLLASSSSGGGGPQPWTDTTSYLDFASGVYKSDEQGTPLGALLEGPLFNPDQISATGMFVGSEPPTNLPLMTAELVSRFENGCTFVLELQSSGVNTALFSLMDHADYDQITNQVAMDYVPAGFSRARLTDLVEISVHSGTNSWLDGAFGRVAVRLGEDVGGGVYRTSISANGNPVRVDNAAAPFPTWVAGAVGVSGNINDWESAFFHQGYIRKLWVYPASYVSDLVALSTMPEE